MALIDSDAGEIVIRLVYDGPPEAGKTTSLRALASSLAQPSYTPAEDDEGHTLWFDWMEYVGGRFEGCQIRCQIVSVPGQRVLSVRRRRIIENADVVVFVGNSSAREVDETFTYLFELREMLAEAPLPAGVILQANKRDLPDAVPLTEVRARLAEAAWPVGVVESVAADGTGIREAFVYAVRLALDRVRELMNRRALPSHTTGPANASELLEALRTGDRATVTGPQIVESGAESVAAALLREVLSCEDDSTHRRPPSGRIPVVGAPKPPSTAVPSGAIWPPVEGRAILSELAQLELVPRLLGTGDWAAGLGSGWRVVSSRDAVFETLDDGRASLIQWARLHSAVSGVISSRRCVVLADDGSRGWRLWQIVRAERSLREAVEDMLRDAVTTEDLPVLPANQGEPAAGTSLLVARLCQVARLLLEADERLAGLPLALPCNLDTVGQTGEATAVYIGLMPGAGTPLLGPRTCGDARSLLRSQLGPLIATDLYGRPFDFELVLARLRATPLHGEAFEPRTA